MSYTGVVYNDTQKCVSIYKWWKGWVWGHVLIIPGFKMLRQGNSNEFNLAYIVRPYLKEENVTKENISLSPPHFS